MLEYPAFTRNKGLRMAEFPSGDNPYPSLIKQCVEAAQSALKGGVRLMELEFPPVKGKLDVSLGETLDANRGFAREITRSFSSQYGKALWLIFPDAQEAELARKVYGQTTFRVTDIKDAAISRASDNECKLQIVVNPGFNIDEWINLEKVDKGCPMIVLNGGFDKLRGGYYPRLFYPGLYSVKERYLQKFEPIYYLKPLAGGWIFRKYPEDWQLLFEAKGTKPITIESFETRPEFNYASSKLKKYVYDVIK